MDYFFFHLENLFSELPQLTLKERLHRYELDETFRFLYLKDLIGNKWIETAGLQLDCLKSVFSLKIRLVLISSSAIANHDVIITTRDSYFFFSGFNTPSFLAAFPLVSLGFASSNFAKKNKRLTAV